MALLAADSALPRPPQAKFLLPLGPPPQAKLGPVRRRRRGPALAPCRPRLSLPAAAF